MTIRAIYEITAALLFCLAVYVVLVQISTPRIAGTRWVALAYLCGAIGTGLIASRDSIPDILSGPVANLFAMLVSVFVYWGFAELLHLRKRRYWLLYIPVFVEPALLYYFTCVHLAYGPRLLAYNIASAFQYVLLAIMIWRHGVPRIKLPSYAIAFFYLLWAGVDGIHAAQVRIHNPSLSSQLNSPPSSIFPFLGIFTTAMTGLGFVWLAMSLLYVDLEAQSRTDSLTGLLNRRAIEELALREISRARRKSANLSLLVLDIDNFKFVNDLYGHDGGDAALAAVAHCLRDNLRNVDLIARLGGEEFVALLPETGPPRGLQVAERLCLCISALRVPHLKKEISFTASFGITTLTPEDASWDEILRRADNALYVAKNNGRNRVEIGQPADSSEAQAD